MSLNLNVKSSYSDQRKIFSERLNHLIDREYGSKRGRKKQFYDDFSIVLENNNVDRESVSESAKKWTTGMSIPGSETLELLAGFFNVSIDYLLGKTDIESSIDENFIMEYTGLEPHATRLLHNFHSSHSKEINTLNYAMEDSSLFLSFFHWISLYIDNDYTIPLATDEYNQYFPCNNAMGSILVGSKMKDNKGNDGYKIIGIGVDILESHAMREMQKIIDDWKNSKKS